MRSCVHAVSRAVKAGTFLGVFVTELRRGDWKLDATGLASSKHCSSTALHNDIVMGDFINPVPVIAPLAAWYKVFWSVVFRIMVEMISNEVVSPSKLRSTVVARMSSWTDFVPKYETVCRDVLPRRP